MHLKTRFNLWKLKKSLGPSPVFKASLKKGIDAAWGSLYGKTPWYAAAGVRPAIGLAVIVLLLVGGGGTYAYTNPEVTEGTMLYPVKQAIETVEEVTKVSPEAKAKFYLKKIERREAEREVLKKKYAAVKVKKEIKHENKIGQNDPVNVSSTVSSSVGVEDTEKEELIKTEQSIEQAELELEQSGKILEDSGSKNMELRTQIKNRVNKRLEDRKKQLENKIEERREDQKVRSSADREENEDTNQQRSEMRGDFLN